MTLLWGEGLVVPGGNAGLGYMESCILQRPGQNVPGKEYTLGRTPMRGALSPVDLPGRISEASRI